MSSASSLSAGSVVRGNIRGEGDLEILGRVEGSIELAGEVLIGETALIKSDVRARRVIVRGAVAGNVSADELIVVEPGARIAGDLGAPQIGIRPGGLVRGHVSTGGPLPVGHGAQAAAKARPGAPAGRAEPARPAARPAIAAPSPGARPAIAAPAARPAARPVAPPPARPAPVRPPSRPEPPRVEVEAEAAPEPPVNELEVTTLGEPDDADGPPPPVVPALRKGAKGALRRKGAR
ncbi:MAG: polymer-forming cytoskeletal protein [Byssovorax sp.]